MILDNRELTQKLGCYSLLQLQFMRQPVPLADGAGAPQGGVPALERLLVLLALRQRGERGVPGGPAPAALMPPSHCRRGQAGRARHLRLIASSAPILLLPIYS
ncbi:hypothetical protein RR48_00166 [Papilio machaon]|uniref:Uncharacterized protein n=1 Tax=Papilio machaon TaxID=76193 RepID=A0A0N0PFF4_PAPMA|nr:hypothetical protein RR48_00166 [Papilio machaon]